MRKKVHGKNKRDKEKRREISAKMSESSWTGRGGSDGGGGLVVWVDEKKKKTPNKNRRKETKENQKRKMMEEQAKPQQTPEEIKKSDEETYKKKTSLPLLTRPTPSSSCSRVPTLHQECVLSLAVADAVVSVTEVDAIV